MKRLIKWVFLAIAAVITLLLIIACGVYYFLGTDSGFAITTKQANARIAGLSIEGVKGNLQDGFLSTQLRYKNETTSINAIDFNSQWRLSCLMDKTFCLDSLHVNELHIRSLGSEAPPTVSNEPSIVLPRIELPINVKVNDLSIKKLLFQGPADTPLQQIDDIRLAANTVEKLLTIELAEATYQETSLAIAGSVTLAGDYPIDLRSQIQVPDILPDTAPEGAGEQALSASISLTNSVRDLSIDALVSGSAEASLTGSIKPLLKGLPVNLTLRSKKLGWPMVSHSQLSAINNHIAIDGSLSDYQIRISAELSGEQIPQTSIELQGLVNKQRLSLPDVQIGTLGGQLAGLAELSWASSQSNNTNAEANSIEWRTEWDIKGLDPSHWRVDFPGSLSGDIRASGLITGDKWTLDLPQAHISGQLKDLPFSLDAMLSKDEDERWEIESIALENASNQVHINGHLADEWALSAAATLPELQNFLPDLHGGFEATADIKGPIQKPDIRLSADVSKITIKDLSLQGLRLDANIKELFFAESDVTINLQALQSGAQSRAPAGAKSNSEASAQAQAQANGRNDTGSIVSNAKLSLSGTRSGHRLKVSANGPDEVSVKANAIGVLDSALNWFGSLDNANIKVPEHSIVLKNKTSLFWSNQLKQFSIDAHCWVSDGSQLCLQDKLTSTAEGTALITLNRYRLRRLNSFLPVKTSLKGTLQMDTALAWSDQLPGGFKATTETLVTDGGARFPDANGNQVNFIYEQLSVDTRVSPENLDVALKLQSKELGSANLALTMNPLAEGRPIEGTINLSGFDIGIAKAFLPEFDEFGGTLSLDGGLSGKLSDPRFDGEVVLNNPVLRAELLPLPISGGNLIASVKGKRAVIDGRLNSDEGVIDVDGSANWQQADAWRADITLKGDKLNIQSDPLIESSVNPNIDISAQPGIIRINGSVDIPMARIDVEDLPQGVASVSSDVIIIEDEELNKTQGGPSATSASETKVLVTVNLNLGDDVQLSAYGLEAYLTGEMSLRLNTPNPVQLGGEVSVVDGIYKQYGQNLNANGQILFVGPVNQTRLSIDAVRSIEEEVDREAGLRIQGTVANPDITLFTEPADKSQDSILSYIVLGRDINETSDQEANLLATAALALTVKGGRNIAGGIASALGVQEFALETRGRGDDTELVVSGRVNDRLLLRYGRSVFEPESTLYLRYDLSKKLYLEAAQGAEQAVDLFYSFSF